MTNPSHGDRVRGLMEYLVRIPHSVPPDRVVVHNNVRPTRQLGSRGFRAWLCPSLEVLRVTPDPGRPVLQLCDCGWAPELGPHYRVKGRWLG